MLFDQAAELLFNHGSKILAQIHSVLPHWGVEEEGQRDKEQIHETDRDFNVTLCVLNNTEATQVLFCLLQTAEKLSNDPSVEAHIVIC